MQILSLLIYLFSIGIALTILYAGFVLYRRHLLRSLLHFLYFLTAFFVSGFIDLIGRYLALKLISGQASETIILLEHIFIFMMFPFIPLSIYFFFLFNRDFTGKSIWNFWMYIYAAFWGVFFLLLVLATKGFLSGQGDGFSRFLFSALGKATFSAYLLIIFYFLLKSKRIKEDNRRKGVRTYSLLYLFGFAITFIVSENWIGLSSESHLLSMICYFSLNVPPLFYLRSHLNQFLPETSKPHLAQEEDLASFFSQFGLSNREQEIFLLILEGKSNKDVTQQLYISLHTVKNHIYHIYQKLGVKNRFQLSRLIREHFQAGKEK